MALLSFISSLEAMRDLFFTVNHCPKGERPDRLASAIEKFTARQCPKLDQEELLTQRHLDESPSRHRLVNLLREANQEKTLCASNATHNGAWLFLPAEKLGLLPPNEAGRTGVALKLDTPIQQPL